MQMWQNLEAKNKYFPKGTNMLLATSIGRCSVYYYTVTYYCFLT